jgi:putative ABC transport system permease protein
MLANGVAVGATASLVGAAVGVATRIVVVPQVERASGHRIDRMDVPWWLVLTGMLLGVATSTAAAWWPSRELAHIPVVAALSGRPPRPKPARRSATAAVLLLAVGVACLLAAGDAGDEVGVKWSNLALIAGGTVAVAIGVLFISPLAIRALGRRAGRLPVAIRLALRDLSRYQARSGAALAAITLGLGIPAAIIISTAAAAQGLAEGNLSDRQIVLRAADYDGPYIPEEGDTEVLSDGIDQVTSALGNPTVTPLMVAIDPDAPTAGERGRTAIGVGERLDDGYRDLSLLYVATPELLRLHDADRDDLGSGADVLSDERSDLYVLGAGEARSSGRREPERLDDVRQLARSYSSLPGTFVTTDALDRRGWAMAESGRWLIEADAPFTGKQLARARTAAASAGLTIESRDRQTELSALRSAATGVGMLLAFGILATTVGLLRSETAGDLRTLTAAGATSGTRRTLTAATAGSLALLGTMLATIGAYVTLAAGYISDLDTLRQVPVPELLLLVVGTPLVATAAGWLLAGREPPALARQPIQ